MKQKTKLVKDTIASIINDNKHKNYGTKNEIINEADFETAIAACHFGKFNYLLIALAIPCGWTSVMSTSVTSYVTPAAHCDLNLGLQERGMLNAIAYLGMISSAFLWGYLADTIGRKRVLVAGYLLDAIFTTIAGLSQSYEMLLTAKYFTGFIINGPFAAMTTAISEYHSARYRTKLIMCLAVTYSIGQVITPCVAWLIIPRVLEYDFFDGLIKLHSWNFFILICALPSLISGLGHIFISESPKFLMTTGRNEEAMKIFKKVYSLNTGLHPDTYPIKSLFDENKLHQGGKHGGAVTANRSKIQALKEGLQQIEPLIFPPYVLKFLLVASIQFGFILGANTIRLWLPQIFTTMNDYQILHPDEPSDLCTMLEIINPKNKNETQGECIVNSVSDSVYINSIIVSCAAVLGYAGIAFIINKVIKKYAMIFLGITSGVATICIYLAQDSPTTVALAALTNTFVGICCNLETAIVVDIFPTTLRAITLSLVLMVGRSGAMIGNVVFPYFLELGCLPPFLLIGCIILFCSTLALLLPRTDMKALV